MSHTRIAICGGGVGGLALAATFARFSSTSVPLEIHIYETTSEITTVGAGISIWKRTWHIMHQLGLDSQLANVSVQPPTPEPKPGFIFRRSDQPQESYDFYQMMAPYGASTMHRADLVNVLLNSLPPTYQIHTSKRLLHYTEQSQLGARPLVLYFADGSTASADILVGADGVNSAVRRSLYENIHKQLCITGRRECRCGSSIPKWSGTVAYRCLLPAEGLSPELHETRMFCGKGRHIVSYPVSQGHFINLVAFVTIPDGEGTKYNRKWVVDVSKEELVNCYAAWEPLAQELLARAESPSLWAIHVIDDLQNSVYGRVALLGDAAHAMTTHFGAGAGQAIEDAYILGRLLTHPQSKKWKVPDVLRLYESIRLPFGRRVVQKSHATGLMYEFNTPGLYDGLDRVGEREHLKKLGKEIYGMWSWQWEREIEEDWAHAQAILKQAEPGSIAYKL